MLSPRLRFAVDYARPLLELAVRLFALRRIAQQQFAQVCGLKRGYLSAILTGAKCPWAFFLLAIRLLKERMPTERINAMG